MSRGQERGENGCLLTHGSKTTTRGRKEDCFWLMAAGEQRGDKGGLLAGSRRQENNAGEKGGLFCGSRRQESNAGIKEACW